MQKLSLALLCILGCALSFSSCKKYDDEWIKIKSDDFEKRIAALETWQTTANSEIISLQNLIKSINENDFVTKVTPLEDGTGYVISFKKSGDITIKHGEKGEKGEKGDMPVIGAKQDTDGFYYWTVGGEWILDGDKKMPVTGEKGADAVAPQLRINEDTLEWEISTDGGKTFASTGIVAKGDKGESMFVSLDNSNDGYLELTMAGSSTKIRLPKYMEFAISFEIAENETFYATPSNNELTLVLPSTLREEDYRSIIAAVTPVKGDNVFVKSGSDWNVEITAPEFDENGNVVEGSAKLAVTGCSDSRLSDTYMLRVALVSADGKEATATRMIKYFDGVIAESTEELTDNNVERLAWKGEITEEDFQYIRENLASTLQLLDLSATEMTELPWRALAFYGSMGLNTNYTLKEVVLPEGLTTIGNSAFAMCAALEKVNFPSTVSQLGKWIFEECENLKYVNIPEGVTDITETFYHATGLKSITVPKTVTTIGEFAFEGCSNLKEVSIKEGVQTIERCAFTRCGSLEEVSIPKSVTYIGEEAFFCCKFLKEITIPEGVTEIKDFTFYECVNLQFVNWHDNITYIGERAFYNCLSLSHPLTSTFMTMPASLQTLGVEAFMYCKKIQRIDMKETQVKVIPYNSFLGCNNLLQVQLPEELETIGSSAFDSTILNQISLPSTMKKIGTMAFASAPIKYVWSRAKTAPELGSSVFSDFVKQNGKLYIPLSSKTSYDTAWKKYFKEVQEQSSL